MSRKKTTFFQYVSGFMNGKRSVGFTRSRKVAQEMKVKRTKIKPVKIFWARKTLYRRSVLGDTFKDVILLNKLFPKKRKR